MRLSELFVPAPDHPSELRKAGTALLAHFWLTSVTYATTLLYNSELKLLLETTPGFSSIIWATFVIVMASHLYMIFCVLAHKNWARWMVAIMVLIAFFSAAASLMDFSNAPLTNSLNVVAFGITAFAGRILFFNPAIKALFTGK